MAQTELTGYNLVKKLKRTRRSINLTSTEQALYHELVSICNEDEWSETFQCSNDELARALLISENTLIASRASLINAGLLFYKSGKSKRKFGEYSFVKKLTTSKFEVDVEVDASVDAEVVPEVDAEVVASDYIKHKQKQKPKQLSEAKASGPAIASSKKNEKVKVKKNEEATEFWNKLVAVWFDFYQKGPGNGAKPTFEGQAPASLKKIVERLKKRTEGRMLTWDEQTACDTLLRFFTYAYGQDWLKDNFLLQNLERQYDKIVNQHGAGNSNNGKGHQPISGISAFQKLSFINNGAGGGAAGNSSQDAAGEYVF